MKIETILSNEAANERDIVLYKEGIFFRAYERSAMRFVQHVAPFKVLKKHYKNVNADVCYLGFPMQNIAVLLQKNNLTRYSETQYYFVLFDMKEEGDFRQWKSEIPLPTVEDYRPQVIMRPDVTPKDMKNLEIFKAGYDLMLELHRYVAQMPRVSRFTIGEQVCAEAIKLGVACYHIGKNENVAFNRSEGASNLEIIRLMLRLLCDLKQMSKGFFAQVNRKIEYLYMELS